MPKKTIFVYPSGHDTPGAIVTVSTALPMDTNAILVAVQRAVTRWTRDTPEGKNAWNDSAHDLNIGDLMAGIDESLKIRLTEEGVSIEDIEGMYSAMDHDWGFDTVLVDEFALEDE